MDVGSELRDARERRRLSIEDLSHVTKITPTILRAIDNNDSAHLPGGIFTRAFVRAYAREVGLDPAGIVQRYESQFEPEPVAAVPPVTEAGIDIGPATTDAEVVNALRWDDVRLLVIAAALVLAAGAYIVFTRPHAPIPRAESEAAATVGGTGRVSSSLGRTAAPGPTGTGGSATRARSIVTNARSLRVELRPRSTCWIAATADGKQVTFRLLNAGERLTLDASDALVLRVGDAGSLDFSINGSRGRPLGGAAQAITIRITPANYRDFIAR